MNQTRRLATSLIILTTAGVTAHAQRGRGRGDEKHEDHGKVVVVSPEEQRQRIDQERQRTMQYRTSIEQEQRALREQTSALQAAEREAAYRDQRAYAARVAEEQRRLQEDRDYSRDPYISAPHTYRYSYNGVARETNQYGIDVLRQAVRYGYQEGFRAGQADRRDHWRADYRNSVAYRDANYGYDGRYVDQGDYNYYFRQGFERGYDDGYYSRYQYGRYTNGNSSILRSVLNTILGLVAIR